jgi:hypothetical protein
MVSLPLPASMVSLIRAARLPVALIESLPPPALSTRVSVVPMSMENGAGSSRSKRTRAPLAVTVKVSAPPPPLTSAVSFPWPPSIRSVSSPGFQIIRSSPLSPNIWSSASPPVSVSLPSPPKSASLPPRPSRASLSDWPKSWSAPEPPVAVSLPLPLMRKARGRAPFDSSSSSESLLAKPKASIRLVLATVGVPPCTTTAPPLTRIVPAACGSPSRRC